MKFKVEVEVSIPVPVEQYVLASGTETVTKLNVLAKDRVAFDIADALRLYGVEALVTHVGKINQ